MVHLIEYRAGIKCGVCANRIHGRNDAETPKPWARNGKSCSPQCGHTTALSEAPWDVQVTLLRTDSIKEKHLWDMLGHTWGFLMSHLYNVREKHYPNSGALLILSCEITWRGGVPAHAQENGCVGKRGRHRPRQEAGVPSAGESNWGGPWLMELRVTLQEAACLSCSFWFSPAQWKTCHFLSRSTKICLPWKEKKKKLINAVKTQGLPGRGEPAIARSVQIQARQSLSGDRLHSLWQGLKSFPLTPTDLV